jgi:hypothetical protein
MLPSMRLGGAGDPRFQHVSTTAAKKRGDAGTSGKNECSENVLVQQVI